MRIFVSRLALASILLFMLQSFFIAIVFAENPDQDLKALECIASVLPDRAMYEQEIKLKYTPSENSRIVIFKSESEEICEDVIYEKFPGVLVSLPVEEKGERRLRFGSSSLNKNLKDIFQFKDEGSGLQFVPVDQDRITHFGIVKDGNDAVECADSLKKLGVRVLEVLSQSGILNLQVRWSQLDNDSDRRLKPEFSVACISDLERNSEDHPLLPDVLEKISQSEREFFEMNWSSSQWDAKSNVPRQLVYVIKNKKTLDQLDKRVSLLSPKAVVRIKETVKIQGKESYLALIYAPWSEHLFKISHLSEILHLDSFGGYYSSKFVSPLARMAPSLEEILKPVDENDTFTVNLYADTIQRYRAVASKLEKHGNLIQVIVHQEYIRLNMGLITIHADKKILLRLASELREITEISKEEELTSPDM